MYRSILPRNRRITVAAGCALLAAASGGCASATSTAAPANAAPVISATPAPRGSVSAGEISITDAYIPQPASPDVAAAYFTVTERGGQGDVLLSATSVPAAQAALMQDSASGADAGTMTDLPHGLAIPAQTSVALGPGGYHLMLTDPAAPLTAGGTVTLTLRFQRAGTVTVEVPVTSLLSDALTAAPNSTSTPAPSEPSDMAGMPGM